MKLKNIIAEDFINYKKPSMFLITCYCNWKCCIEANIPTTVCQNEPMSTLPIKEFSYESIYNLYINNDITQSICIGGLEPFLQFDELLEFVRYFRDNGCTDDIVIYTGYYEHEILDYIEKLKKYENIIIKFGRYIPNDSTHYDDVLGINLASANQYARKIS